MAFVELNDIRVTYDGKNDILSIRQIDHEKCLSLFEHYEAKKAQRY